MFVRCVKSYRNWRQGRIYDLPGGVADTLLKRGFVEPEKPVKQTRQRAKMMKEEGHG